MASGVVKGVGRPWGWDVVALADAAPASVNISQVSLAVPRAYSGRGRGEPRIALAL